MNNSNNNDRRNNSSNNNNSSSNNTTRRLLDAFPFFFLLFNLLFTFFLTYVAGFRFIHFNLAVVLGTLIYIKKRKEGEAKKERKEKGKRKKDALMILFMIFYALSIYFLSFTNYTRPIIHIGYFIFISFASVIVGVEILYVETKRDVILNFLKSFLLVLNLWFSLHIITGGSATGDAPYHIYGISKRIIEEGYLSEEMGVYSYYPALHILNAQASILGSTGIWATWCFVTAFISSLGVFFAFLIGRKFVNEKVGLFSALLFSTSHLLINKTIVHPMSLTTFLFLLSVYLLLSSRFLPKVSWSILMIPTFFVLIIGHHHSTALFIIFLLSLVAIQLLSYFKPIKSNFKSCRFFVPIAIFLTCFISYWIYVSRVFHFAINAINFFVERGITRPAQASDILQVVPLHVTIFNEIGFSILIMLATFGLLHSVRKASPLRLAASFCLIGYGGLVAFGYLFPRFGYLLPFRIFTLAELFMIFLAAESLFLIFKKKTLLIGIIFLLSFFMTSNFYAYQNSSPFVFNNWVTIQSTQQNFFTTGARWVGENLHGEISYNETNPSTWDSEPLHNIYGSVEEIFNENYIIRLRRLRFDSRDEANISYIQNGSYVVFDKRAIYYGLGSGGGQVVLSPSVLDSFNNFDKLYSNGMVYVYRR
jgi:hypothetical protein